MVERSVWYSLPEEVAERIFSYLPIASVLRCRCVCRSWNSLLNSRSFLELWGRVSPRDFFFLVYHNSQLVAAYSPSSGRWNNLPIFDRCSLDPGRVLLLASSGGLLCFRNRNSDYPTLIVCNPVTGTSRVLPEMLRVRYIDIVGMVADKASNSYRVLVTGTTEPTSNESITEVYDSRVEGWIHHGFSKLDFLQVWYEVHAIWQNGSFYCLATPVNTARGYRFICYNLERRQWLDLNVKMPSSDIRSPSLVVCGDKMLLTGKIVVDYFIRSICIWELNWGNLKWVRVGEMPEDELTKIMSPYSVLLQCQGLNDLMCFSTHRGWQSIIYDLSERRWQWLPENDAYEKNHTVAMGRNSLVGLPYEPSLSAKV
ncbi:F-box/kelch-repeat protein [Nymphaea thermarum]|nr:F-box/kelch-repeat protein [Nymphaea thermarum]